MNKQTIIYGFAIFSMFFGSGNLVFPLQVGIENAYNWQAAYLGFFCTGIILPFLGLFVIKLKSGSYEDFFAEAGILAKFIIPIFTLSLLGPFGVVPRCITVAFGGFEYIAPQIPILYFSGIFCIICFFICKNEKAMFNILGKFLTPILLVFLIILIVSAVWTAPELLAYNDEKNGFSSGFNIGYSTMDLFAAFFFSSIVFKQIESKNSHLTKAELIKAAIKPSMFGGTILALIYLGFAYIGAHYTHALSDISGQMLLPTIAHHVFGNLGAIFISIIMILSCLTTAVALQNIFTKYICSFDIIGPKYFNIILLITSIISFTFSLFNFSGIAAILSPLLEISYPGLIALTILSILSNNKYKRLKIAAFYGISCYMIWSLI